MALECVRCGARQFEQDASFCEQCSFPLMLIAGKYRLQKLLASGGQGKVYLAHHVELSREPERVIKIVPHTLFEAHPTLFKRFKREIQLTSWLSTRCEQIVRVYDDFGEIPVLGHFYVMEYLEGKSLYALLQQNKALSLRRCASLMMQFCDAMIAAHEEQIVHRDLKPENLMLVASRGATDLLKIVDFGIAKPLTGDSTQFTQGILGTPGYMAPEQLRGQQIDHRTDIYAMGAILYEMLAGRPPFADDGGGASHLTLMARHLTEAPPKLRDVAPKREISPELEAVVLRALAKEPTQRFDSVVSFKQTLSSVFAVVLGADHTSDSLAAQHVEEGEGRAQYHTEAMFVLERATEAYEEGIPEPEGVSTAENVVGLHAKSTDAEVSSPRSSSLGQGVGQTANDDNDTLSMKDGGTLAPPTFNVTQMQSAEAEVGRPTWVEQSKEAATLLDMDLPSELTAAPVVAVDESPLEKENEPTLDMRPKPSAQPTLLLGERPLHLGDSQCMETFVVEESDTALHCVNAPRPASTDKPWFKLVLWLCVLAVLCLLGGFGIGLLFHQPEVPPSQAPHRAQPRP